MKTKSWQEETSEKEKKIQDISEEKGAPSTTKQTVTLTTVAGQKVQEKSLNGTYRLQRRIFRERPLHLYYHDNHTGYTTETTYYIMITSKPKLYQYQ